MTALRESRTFFLFLFLLGAIAFDRGTGALLRRLHHSLDGRIANGDLKVQAVATHDPVDVLVLGDSRIRGGIDPKVVTARSGLSAYNAGFDGRGAMFARGLQSIRIARGLKDRCYALSVEVSDLYEPRVLRQTPLLPYLDESPVILDLAEIADPWARVKALSAMWPYNSLLPEMARRSLFPTQDNSLDGFRANHLRWDLRFLPPLSPLGSHDDGTSLPEAIDPLGEQIFDDFIASAEAAGARVVLFTGPMHRNKQLPLAPGELEPVRVAARSWYEAYAARKGIPYLSFDEQRMPEFQDPELYTDQIHLNATGAARLSERFGEAIRAACAR